MEKRTYFISLASFIYLILIALYSKIEFGGESCEDDFDTMCIPFCSTDKVALSDEKIRENYPFSDLIHSFVYDNYTIKRGMPNCLLTKVLNLSILNTNFEDESYESLIMTPNYYCNQLVDLYGEDLNKWELITCDSKNSLVLVFHAFGE